MKKFIALLCALLSLTMLVSCSRHGSGDTDTSVVVRDPQKEEALPSDELTQFAVATQALTNYRLAYSYESDTENIATIVMHDGKDEQQQVIFHNKKYADGSVKLEKKEQVRYVWSEKAKYVTANDETTKRDHEFALPADKTTFGEMVNQLVCPNFYEAIIERMSNATYDIIHDRYYLDAVEIQHDKETFMFDEVYITVENRQLTTIVCKNDVQILEVSVTGINNVNFDAE